MTTDSLLIGVALALLSSCGGGGPSPSEFAGQIEQALGWWESEETVSAGPLPEVDIPQDAWVKLDPVRHSFTGEGSIFVDAWVPTGGAGVLVEYDGGGPFELVFRLRAERLSFGAGLRAGLVLAGADARRDPLVAMQIGSSGGQGDERLLVGSMSSVSVGGGMGMSSGTFAAFAFGESVRVRIHHEGARTIFEQRTRTGELLRHVVHDAFLPPGVYLVGLLPDSVDAQAPKPRIVRGQVEIESVRGTFKALRAVGTGLGDRMPALVELARKGELGARDPYAEAARLVARGPTPRALWRDGAALLGLEASFVLRPSLRLQLARVAHRNGDPDVAADLYLRAWHESALDRVQGRATSLLHDVPLWESLSPPLNREAKHRLFRAAATMMPLLTEQDPSLNPLLLILADFRSDFAVERTLELARRQDASKLALVLPHIDRTPIDLARLVQLADLALQKGDRETARQALSRALDHGVCQSGMDRMLSLAFDDPGDRLARWHALRAAAVPRLRAAMQHLRWSGFAELAAHTAMMVLDLVAVPYPEDVVRETAPVLKLGRSRDAFDALRAVQPTVVDEAVAADPVLALVRR